MTLEFWLRARFSRRALPTAFDQRLGNEQHKQIRDALLPIADHVVHLLYSLSTEDELEGAQAYEIRVVILATSESMGEAALLEALEAAKDAIEDALARPGINATVDIVSENTMPYADFRTFAPWGLEDLSLEDGLAPA